MGFRSSGGALAVAAAATVVVAGVVATPVLAAGNGLPRTYDVQRVDSPEPEQAGLFSLSMHLAGDLNGDGEQDLISPQVAGFNTQGRVYVFSGETGARLDTVNAPDPSTVGGNAQFGLLGTAKVGDNRGTPSDLGSCPGGTSGQTCPASPIGPPDGVPDLLIGATGVDVAGVTDVGRVYVLDGRTRAVLKRIDMPAADRALTGAGAGFGREVLTPAGLPGCEGNAGIGPCEMMPPAVQAGDMDGGGRPDVVVGARRFNETPGTAAAGSHCAAAAPTATCAAAGRAYVFRGEDIVNSAPTEILDGTGAGETVRTIRNPDAQADDPVPAISTAGEGFGNDLIPIGDVGRCNNAALAPGARCPRGDSTATADGRPEVVIAAPGTDYPLDDPDAAFSDAGAAHLVDGATGTILHTYLHPEPQRAAGFGGSYEHTLAAGDMGDTGHPDVSLGAPGQDAAFKGSGRAYVMSGNFRTSAGLTNIARLDDPTPEVTEENFGGSSAGVGDLVPGAEAPANEIMIGQSGPRTGPFVPSSRPIDIGFFNPSTERVLQLVPDPDAQTSSAFGDSIEPLGDLNEDGFLDFAVGAFRFVDASGTSAGRFYIFRSDNSPAPAAPAAPPAAPAAPDAPPATSIVTPLVGRALELTARPGSIRGGQTVRLNGLVEAFSDVSGCVAGQDVQLQRRQATGTRYATFARVQTAADGAFTATDKPTSAVHYRALATQTPGCIGVASNDVEVAVPPEVGLVTRSTSLPGNRAIRIQLRCPTSGGAGRGPVCQGSVKLRTAQTLARPGGGRARLTLGTAAFQIPAGRRRTTRILVTPVTARALRRGRQVRVTAFITNRDAAGNTVATRGSFTLRTR